MNKFYKDIDEMPIYNFEMINKTGNLQYLAKRDYKKVKVDKSLEVIWENIYNEYLQEFGINENFVMYLKYKLEAIKYYNNAYNKGLRHEINFAKLAEKNAEELINDGSDISVGDIASVMAKNMGFRINIKEISVREFYNNIKLMQKNNGENN